MADWEDFFMKANPARKFAAGARHRRYGRKKLKRKVTSDE
jgi:hypothetical protein